MKTLAIIAEYNPYHNGHAYLLEQAKTHTDADYAIALMSGHFLQRGEPAMWDKYTRAKMSALAGVDIVFELPFAYATGSAMDFADGAVRILDAMHTIDFLCFGAEDDDINTFETLADLLLSEPDAYKASIKAYLANGMSYPAAREQAVAEYTGNTIYASLLSKPNNILALEYICALKRAKASIKPVLIARKHADYHDNTLYGNISSATAIRTAFSGKANQTDDEKFTPGAKVNATTDSFPAIEGDVPDAVCSLMKDIYGMKAPVFPEDLDCFLQAARLMSSDNTVREICDMSDALANSLSALPCYMSVNDTTAALKSKNYTAARIRRALLHMILGYTEKDRRRFIESNYAQYASILSLRRESSPLLKQIGENSSIPLITKKADFRNYFADDTKFSSSVQHDIADRMWELDIKAGELYNCLIFNRYGFQNTNDYTTTPSVV